MLNYQIISGDGGLAIIRCSGRLTLPTSAGFIKISDEMKALGRRDWQLDLSGVEFIDSAGMWMLLMVRDVVLQLQGKLQLTGATGQVAKALDLASFDEIMRSDA